MRFLALATSDDRWFASASSGVAAACGDAEALRTWELREAGLVREIWWRTDRRDVVIELEAPDEDAARAALGTLPFVRAGALSFELIGLRPYDGWRRLFAPDGPARAGVSGPGSAASPADDEGTAASPE
jgi:hypothetical protein